MVNVQGVLGQLKVCIVIPVYNEAQAIGTLVKELRAKHLDVVVINDGSSDQSGKIAQQQGAIVLQHEVKKGKGLSLQTGFRYALEQHYDSIIAMDGDGQHAVEDVDRFIEKAKGFPLSIINGNRMENHREMPFVRFWTNRIMSVLISCLCKQKIPDTQCGFRLISTQILRQLTLAAGDFEIETEVLIKASKKGFKIYSVPIKTIYRGEVSHINPILDTVRFFVYIFKETWNSKN